MSAESDFEEARQRIARAKAEGYDQLDLSDLHNLSELPPEIADLALTRLALHNTQVADITPLTGMTAMTTLTLNNTQVTDIPPLKGMTAMETLTLNNTQVADITPLMGMTDMTTLHLANTQVNGIAPLSEMSEMTTLSLNNTLVSDLAPLSGMTRMNVLTLHDTQVSDIAALSGMSELAGLSLANTQVSDIAPLAHMLGMTQLSLYNTPVTDISVLAPMKEMVGLSLGNTPITDISPILGMSGIATLTLDNTGVNDLRGLLNLTQLESPDSEFAEVRIKGCAATELDSGLAKIAAIQDNADRAKRLFERLREIGDDWPPAELVPQDSPAAPHYVLDPDRPLHSLDTPPEGGDPDQEDLQEELRHKVRVLLETIGASNEYAPLKRSAETYMRQIDRRLSGIRLRILWSAANSLRLAVNANQRADDEGRINDMLPPLAAAALEDLVQTHGLFILGFPNAAELEAEMRSYLGRGRNPEQVEAAKDVVSALEGQDSAIEPEDNAALQADALAADGTGPDAEMAEISLFARLGNMLGAAGRAMRKAVVAGGGAVLSHDFIQFLIGNQTLIMKYLKLAMDQASAWLPRLLDLAKGLMGG